MPGRTALASVWLMNSLSRLLPLAALLLSAFTALAEDNLLPNGDFSKGLEGWEVRFAEEAAATTEVVKDGYEGKPALKIQVGDTEIESWKGSAFIAVPLEAGATYTFKCYLMSEPDDSNIEIVAWGRNPADKNSTLYGDRTPARPTQAFEEFTAQFTVTEAKERTAISLNNLARANRIIWIANCSLTKN